MGLRILDATTRAAVIAATTQQGQAEALIAPWSGGNVTARLFAADGTTLLRTLTLGPFTINATDPVEVECAAHLADTHVATGTPGLWVFRAGSTDILSIDAGTSGASVNHAGAIKALCTPTLAGVTFTATPTLEAPTFSPGNVLLTLAGQSNADGRGLITDISASPLSSDSGLATLAGSAFGRVYIWASSAWSALELGVNNGGVNPAPGSGTQFGPEFGIAVRWMRETDSGNLYIVKNGASGASITGFEPGAGFNQYQILQSAHTSAQAALSSGGVTIAQKCFVWHQGETDASETQAFYETRMQDILDAAYLDSWFASTDRQILFQVGTTSTLYGAGPAAAKASLAAGSPDYIKAPASANYYGADGYHQNARGQVQIGYDAFSLIFDRSTITV